MILPDGASASGGPAPQVVTDAAGNQLSEILNIGPGTGATRAAAFVLSGGNGTGPNGAAFSLGIDTSAATPYRDYFFAKVLSNGTVSDPDGIYISHGGAGPSSVGIGQAQPGDSGRSVRLKVASGSNSQGGIQVVQATTVTVSPLSVTDTNSKDRFFIDPTSSTNTWNTVMSGDTSTNNPIFTVRDITTNTTISFQVSASGNLTIKNPGAAACQFSIANNQQTSIIQTISTGELQVSVGGNTLVTFGNHNTSWNALGFFGAAAVAQPSAAGSAAGYTAGATAATFHSDDTYTGNTGTTAYTINGIVAALKNLGLLHS